MDDDLLAAEIVALGDVVAAVAEMDRPTQADIDRMLGVLPPLERSPDTRRDAQRGLSPASAPR